MTEQKAGGIYTYCIEYAKTQQSKCDSCKAIIPNKSLRAAEIYRKNAKVKKNLAKHTWYHFKCWKLPELLVKLPLDLVRGYPDLQEKDKARVQKLVGFGVGATWKDIMNKEKVDTGEEEEEKPKKSKEIEDDVDMTEGLTGVQDNTEKKKEKKKEKKEKSEPKKNSEKIEKKKDDKSKVNKNKKPAVKEMHKKEIALPKQDQNELESIAKEFQALKKSKK